MNANKIETTNGGTMVTGSDAIAFASLASLRGAVRLESVGMKRRGRSAVSIAKEVTGLKTNKHALLIAKIEEMMDEKRKLINVPEPTNQPA